MVLDHNSYLRQPVLPFRESSWYCMLGSWKEEGPCEILRISNRDVEKTVWLVTGEGLRLDTMRQSPPPRQHNCYPWFLEFAGHVVSTLLEIGGP